MNSPPEAYRFDPEDYVGVQVLITGHHRFLALLLCGLPSSELPPIQVRTARAGRQCISLVGRRVGRIKERLKRENQLD
jgi:hypothetical protein